VVIKDDRIVDFQLQGYADIEKQAPIAEDTIYRIYSSTKIITAVAALMLYEEGCFQMDDPLAKYIPEFSNLKVLSAGATDVSQTEALKHPPTVRQVLCHNAGFSYGTFQESLVDTLYSEKQVLGRDHDLNVMCSLLADIPLAYQPGARWQYSVSSDIVGRLVEIWSGQTFGEFLKARIFDPLGMKDTDFYVHAGAESRLANMYMPEVPMQPMTGGLKPCPPGVVYGPQQPQLESGGAGLFSTITDYTRFVQMLMAEGSLDGTQILTPESINLMQQNQLPAGIQVQMPNWFMPDTLFGVGVAVKQAPAEGEPSSAIGEYHWGGVAGTQAFMSPQAKLAGLIFIQRMPGFWHPFYHDFKRLVYQATAG